MKLSRTMSRSALLGAAVLATGTLSGFAAVPASAHALPSCGNHSFTIRATSENGGSEHANFVLLFKNRSSKTCTVHGYPGVDAVTKHGHVLAHAKRSLAGYTGGSQHGVPTVTVKPGHYASADVEWLDFNPKTGGNCRFSHAVEATPANTSATKRLGRSVSICQLRVHPTVPGRSGNLN